MVFLGQFATNPALSPTLIEAFLVSQLEVNEVFIAYPHLTIDDSQITSKPWEGYLLIDLCEAYAGEKAYLV